MPTKQQIYDVLQVASELALEYVEQEARAILKSCPKYKEFIMGMGSACFSDGWSNFSPVYSDKMPKRAVELICFISEIDEYLRLSGNPMRFTADGEKITDW